MEEVIKVKSCPDCEPVTRAECNARHTNCKDSMDELCERLDAKDVSDARNEGVMSVQTKLLWGIFAVLAAQFVANIFTMYAPK